MCGFLADLKSEHSDELLRSAADLIQHRGPDETVFLAAGPARFIFHRLAIMDLSERGRQPLQHADTTVVCNGEIYNEPELRDELESRYTFRSGSDCEVLLPLYQHYGVEGLLSRLDGEFAFTLYDSAQGQCVLARDPLGVRPLFYGFTAGGGLMIASEVKALHELCLSVRAVPPGHYYVGKISNLAQGSLTSAEAEELADQMYAQIKPYSTPWEVTEPFTASLDEVKTEIRDRLTRAVEKRLRSDAPVGFLLSGGLDSSLVCAIAARMSDRPIKTFSIGIKDGPIDTHYAREVAEMIGSEHHEYLFTRAEMEAHLYELVAQLETWDITTVRASIGMSLLCRYIRQNTDVKVLLTGEVSDEIFGYKYTDFAPSPEAFQGEAEKRVRELYVYDILRADRCISMHGLEARVPFSDTDFVSYVMSLTPEIKVNTYGMGKYLLRAAFESDERGQIYLPKHILYRQKAAFSDAVGHSMVDYLKESAAERYTAEDISEAADRFPHSPPFTAESLWYREIFESYFPGRAELIPAFWMPNAEWEGCAVDDPSARVLANYGASGDVISADDEKIEVA